METLEKKLGYAFENRQLLEEALNHSSYANRYTAAKTASTASARMDCRSRPPPASSPRPSFSSEQIRRCM